MRDAVRPLIVDGFAELERRFGAPVALEHAYTALLTGCVKRSSSSRVRSWTSCVARRRRASAAPWRREQRRTSPLRDARQLLAGEKRVIRRLRDAWRVVRGYAAAGDSRLNADAVDPERLFLDLVPGNLLRAAASYPDGYTTDWVSLGSVLVRGSPSRDPTTDIDRQN